MTFSIVGQVGEAFGVAVASKFPFVGAVVPQARLGVGAVATQAMARFSYRETALAALAGGGDARGRGRGVHRTRRRAASTASSASWASRSQATWTGSECMDWAGGVSGRDEHGGYAIQGNILTGPDVVAAMEQAWLDHRAGRSPTASSRPCSRARPPVATRVAARVRRCMPCRPARGTTAVGCSRTCASTTTRRRRPGAGPAAADERPLLRHGGGRAAPRGRARRRGGWAAARPGLRGERRPRRWPAWAGQENYEMRLSPQGIDTKVLAALRDATP